MRTSRRTGPVARPLASTSFAAGIAAACAAGAAFPAACSSAESSSESAPAVQGAPEAHARAAAIGRSLKARFPAAFLPAGGPVEATVTLPATADRPFRVRDRASKIEISVALEGAAPVDAAEAEDLVVYADAAPGGGTVVHRVVPHGVEDLVHFAARPGSERLAYTLALGAARGLRVAGGGLEVLDENGVPVLRAAPPYVVDARGAVHEAALSVEGCAVDTDGRPPFGRAVTPPGATSCTVVVDWSRAAVAYPALVDPVWGSTFNTMAVPRTRHTITLLNDGLLAKAPLSLVVGGSSTVNGAPLKSAEIYDPLSRRFSNTNAFLNVARSGHTATLLSTVVAPQTFGTQKPVLVAGGVDAAGNPIGSLEVYDPASSTFVTDANTMAVPRFEHVAVLVADNHVLLAGGTAPPQNQPTNTAYTYTFTGFGSGSPPSTVSSTLAAVPDLMESARTGFAATRLTTGEVLLTGGFVLAGGSLQALQSGEIYDPTANTFSEIETSGTGVDVMATQRGYHTSTALGTSGDVLIAGGLSKTVGGTYTNTVDIYADGSQGGNKGFIPQAVPITMLASRANHTATLLPNGTVLVAGGFSGSPAAAIGKVDVFDPVTSTFLNVGTPVDMQPRGDFAALLVNAGDSADAGRTLLVTGGANAPTNGAAATAGAQILLREKGDPCTIDADCLSGFCTDGVCCLERCDAQCHACSAATKQSGADDGVCGYAKQGTELDIQCINQVETHTVCDGNGGTEQAPETHSCIPASCGSDNFCSKGCNQTADCDVTGWCDLTVPGEDGFLGTCVSKKVQGAPCYGDDQCAEGRPCVDGVCCGSDCDSQCQACDLPGFVGTCQFVGAAGAPEPVHPNADGQKIGPRTACDGYVDGQATACTGGCTGQALCTYPGADVFIQDDSCADDANGGPSTLTKYPCDATGGSTLSESTCGGFRCADATACKTSCATDTDCIDDFVCTDGACVALTGPLCDGYNILRKPKADGGYEVCPDNYACPAGATACLTECSSINDCITPPADGDEEPTLIVCNGARQCVPEPEPPLLSSCSAAPARGAGSTAGWLAGALVALAAARRRRASRRDDGAAPRGR